MHQIQRIANSIAKFQYVLRPALESKGIIFDRISNIDYSGLVKLKNNYLLSISIPPHEITRGVYEVELFDYNKNVINDSKIGYDNKKELCTTDDIYSEIVFLDKFFTK